MTTFTLRPTYYFTNLRFDYDHETPTNGHNNYTSLADFPPCLYCRPSKLYTMFHRSQTILNHKWPQITTMHATFQRIMILSCWSWSPSPPLSIPNIKIPFRFDYSIQTKSKITPLNLKFPSRWHLPQPHIIRRPHSPPSNDFPPAMTTYRSLHPSPPPVHNLPPNSRILWL